MEGLCAASSGHLLVGWWGIRLDPRQKLALRLSPCCSKAENAGFRILDVPKNGGQSGFLSFGRGPSSNCCKGEAILKNLGGGCLDIPDPKEEASSVLAKVLVGDNNPTNRKFSGFVSGTGIRSRVQLMERKGRGWPSPIILTLCSQMS